MARTVTVTTLISEFRQRGDYNRSAVFSDAVITGYLSRAWAKVYDLLVQCWQDYYLTETTLTTSSGSDSVNLPADFYKLRALDYQHSSTRHSALRKFQLKERNHWNAGLRGTAYGPRYHYRIEDGNPAVLRLLPEPTSADTLRLFYIPHATALTTGSDTIDTINDYDDLLLERALLYADIRERRPIQERLAVIGKLEQEVRRAADGRDSSEPEYLAEPNSDWLF